MKGSAKVRAVRKKAQLARLKRKEDADYPAYYAKMPQQKVKAAAAAEIRESRQALTAAIEALAIAEITGKGLLQAQEQATVARLVLEKLEAAQRPDARISLTAVGSGA